MITANTLLTALVTVLVAMFGSTGFWTWWGQRRTHRHIEERVNAIEEKMEANEARGKRQQILTFADDIRTGHKRSIDHYDSILIACDEYERYCLGHPGFKNSVAVISIEKIKDSYKKGDNFL